ncbi:MAG: cytochrome c maturation protein CcmE [Wolbachia endosymbiont of Fragariocoptes setiger]|nr:cytochrome c maturation protein CcmE [Wolbachia endosymbiont of Fragariocoptes setiger]
MKKKHKRLTIVLCVFCLLSSTIFFVLTTLKQNISFFYTVSEASVLQNTEKSIRIGGIVEKNSVIYRNNDVVFHLTDFNKKIKVTYKGILPPMFSEGEGVVIQGIMLDGDIFLADKVFAKHDENYKPKNQSKNILK